MPNLQTRYLHQERKNNQSNQTSNKILSTLADTNYQINSEQSIILDPQIFTGLSISNLSNSKNLVLLLLVGLHIQTAFAAVNQPVNQDIKALRKKEVLDRICQTKVTMFNKPDFKIKIHQDFKAPASCTDLVNASPLCIEQTKKLQHFINNRPSNAAKLDKIREQQVLDYNKWKNNLQVERFHYLPEPQLAIFYKYLNLLGGVKDLFGDANTYAKLEGGNCGESTGANLKKILLAKNQFGFDINIQIITLFAQNGDNHCFLVIDGKNPVKIIKDDQDAAAKFIQNLQGTIYDPWNNFCGTLAEDNNDLYDVPNVWNSLKVQEINLDSAELTQLPNDAQNFICENIQLLGLSLYPRKPCNDARKSKGNQIANVLVVPEDESAKYPQMKF